MNARSLVLCGILFFSSGDFAATAQHVNSTTLLEKVAATLSAITSVSYHYSRVINYDSMNYHNQDEQDGYIDFQPENGMPFTFQAKRLAEFQVFNGSEVLYGMAATHDVRITPVRNIEAVANASFLLNSYVTLRKALPTLLTDQTVRQSSAECDKATCQVSLTLHQAVPARIGDFSPIQKPRDIPYALTIDRSTLLPTAVKQTASDTGSGEYTDVHFSQIDTHPTRPADSTWAYTGYPGYKLSVPGVAPKMLEVGTVAPTWQLPAFGNEQKVDLRSAGTEQGIKFILLEFWISHCGYSIEAVQTLNSIGKRFPEVKILAINPDDDEGTVDAFRKSQAPHYTLLHDTAAVSAKYGVAGYPTIYLLDSGGRILYAGNANESKITAAIQHAKPS